MLTEATLRRALRQMRLYGEIGPDRFARPKASMPVQVAGDGQAPRAGQRKARVWDEEKGAFLLKPI